MDPKTLYVILAESVPVSNSNAAPVPAKGPTIIVSFVLSLK